MYSLKQLCIKSVITNIINCNNLCVDLQENFIEYYKQIMNKCLKDIIKFNPEINVGRLKQTYYLKYNQTSRDDEHLCDIAQSHFIKIINSNNLVTKCNILYNLVLQCTNPSLVNRANFSLMLIWKSITIKNYIQKSINIYAPELSNFIVVTNTKNDIQSD